MKKVLALIITFLFLLSNNIQASLFQAPNPYSFGPQGRAVSDLRDFAKPKYMANILAGRPVVATRSDGTRVYYTSDGKLSLSIKENGEMTFSLGGYSKSTDKFGQLKTETKVLEGNLQEVRNEFGEIQSYNQLDGSGKCIASYDKDMNKTATYHYDKFGKTLAYSINEMTKQKTVYDKFERAMAMYSADGYILTTYQYEDVEYDTARDRRTLITTKKYDAVESCGLVTMKTYNNKMLSTDDKTGGATFDIMSHDTTFYDRKGLILRVDNYEGITTHTYSYKKDSSGNKVLDYVLDTETKNKTYYENNKQMYVKNDAGAVIMRYEWLGSKYLYSVNIGTDGNIISSTDKDGITVYGNIIYNEDKTINTIYDEHGNKSERYHYTEDEDGNSILDYIENLLDGTKTYYDELGRSIKTVDKKGNVITDYGWNKSNLVYSFNRKTGVTSWYVPGEKEDVIVYETLDDRIMSKNLYVAGQLIGKFELVQGDGVDANGNHYRTEHYSLTLFINEQQVCKINNYTDKEPTENDAIKYLIAFSNGTLSDVLMKESYIDIQNTYGKGSVVENADGSYTITKRAINTQTDEKRTITVYPFTKDKDGKNNAYVFSVTNVDSLFVTCENLEKTQNTVLNAYGVLNVNNNNIPAKVVANTDGSFTVTKNNVSITINPFSEDGVCVFTEENVNGLFETYNKLVNIYGKENISQKEDGSFKITNMEGKEVTIYPFEKNGTYVFTEDNVKKLFNKK